MTAIDALKNTELFQDLPDAALDAIGALATSASFEDNDPLYSLGDDANDLFILTSGRVRFSIGVGNRPDGSASIMTPVSVIGWAALLQEQPRRVATATCLEDSELYKISGKSLLELFDLDKATGYIVMRRLATMIARDFVSVLST